MSANDLYASLLRSRCVQPSPVWAAPDHESDSTETDSEDEAYASEPPKRKRLRESDDDVLRTAFEMRSERTEVSRALRRLRGTGNNSAAIYAKLLSGRDELNELREIVGTICKQSGVKLDVGVDFIVVEIERFLFTLLQLEPVYRTALSGRGFNREFCQDFNQTHRFMYKLHIAFNFMPALRITSEDAVSVFATAVREGTFTRAFEYMRQHKFLSRHGLAVQISKNVGMRTDTLEYIVFSADFNTWLTAVCGKLMVNTVQVQRDATVQRRLLMPSSALVALKAFPQAQITAALVWMHVAVDAYICAMHNISARLVQHAFYRHGNRKTLLEKLTEYALAHIDELREMFIDSGGSDEFVRKFSADNVSRLISAWPKVVRTGHANGKGFLMFLILVGYKRMIEIMDSQLETVGNVLTAALHSDTPFVRQCLISGVLLKMILLLRPVRRQKSARNSM